MLSVSSFCVFCVWFVVLCRFFTIFLVLGSLFEKMARKILLMSGFFSGNRTVTLCLVGFPPSRRGKCCPFFSLYVFCGWFGVFCRFFTVLLFLGSLFEKIFGSELLFLGVGVGRVFFGAVFPMFLLYCLVFRSRKCLEKILLMSGLLFLGFFSLFLWFFRRRRVFFVFLREKAQVVTGHTPTRTWVVFSCSFFLSRRTCLFALFGRASRFLRFCRGAILGPARFWVSPGTYGA